MRKALVIGIDDYPSYPLKGCVNDAISMRSVLDRHSDGSPNFSVKQVLAPPDKNITRALLKEEIESLFSGDPDIALFYFSGHGCMNSYGGSLVSG